MLFFISTFIMQTKINDAKIEKTRGSNWNLVTGERRMIVFNLLHLTAKKNWLLRNEIPLFLVRMRSWSALLYIMIHFRIFLLRWDKWSINIGREIWQTLYGLPPWVKGHGGISKIFGCCWVNNNDHIIWPKHD